MATKEQKQNQKFAEKLLRIKGIEYDNWLDEKHQEVIQSNQSLILEALESKLNNKKPTEQKPTEKKEQQTNSGPVASGVIEGSTNN